MKKCTWCGREHPDHAAVCVLDGQPLRDADPAELTVAAPAPHPVPEAQWRRTIRAAFARFIAPDTASFPRYLGKTILLLVAGLAGVVVGIRDQVKLAELRASGVQVHGTLEMMTRQTLNFVPWNYSLNVRCVDSVGRSRVLKVPVSRTAFNGLALADGKTFTKHEVELRHLSSDPEFIRLEGNYISEFGVLLWLAALGALVVGLFQAPICLRLYRSRQRGDRRATASGR